MGRISAGYGLIVLLVQHCLFQVTAVDESVWDCDFDTGSFCDWYEVSTAEPYDGRYLAWRVLSGSTPSGNTGPSDDFYGGGYYAYVEANSNNMLFDGKGGSRLQLDFGRAFTGTGVSFAYHLFGSGMGQFRLMSTQDGVNWDTIWMKEGNIASGWLFTTVDITDNPISLQFANLNQTNSAADSAVDEIKFISSPTSQPTHAPTVSPIPAPTFFTPQPSPRPTPSPIPLPTFIPIPDPTPKPTMLPIPSPSAVPIPSPSSLPVPQPTPSPSFHPTEQPTPLPIVQPTPPPTPRPSPRPSISPTSSDGTVVIVGFDMIASNTMNEHDRRTLRQGLETAFAADGDIGDAVIKNFQATSVTTRRLGDTMASASVSDEHHETRKLPTTWTVSCDVYVDMSTTTASTAAAFKTLIQTAVTSNTFTSAVSNTTGVLDETSVSLVAITNQPSQEPTAQPTFQPTHAPTYPFPTPQPTADLPTSSPVTLVKGGGGGSASDNLVNATIGGAAVFVFLISVACMVRVFICKRRKESTLLDDQAKFIEFEMKRSATMMETMMVENGADPKVAAATAKSMSFNNPAVLMNAAAAARSMSMMSPVVSPDGRSMSMMNPQMAMMNNARSMSMMNPQMAIMNQQRQMSMMNPQLSMMNQQQQMILPDGRSMSMMNPQMAMMNNARSMSMMNPQLAMMNQQQQMMNQQQQMMMQGGSSQRSMSNTNPRAFGSSKSLSASFDKPAPPLKSSVKPPSNSNITSPVTKKAASVKESPSPSTLVATPSVKRGGSGSNIESPSQPTQAISAAMNSASPSQSNDTPSEDIVSSHPDLPKLVSTKRIFHIPVKSLMLEQKAFAQGTGGQVKKGLYMGNPIVAKPVINIVKKAKSSGESKVDLNDFDNEIAILMKLSHPSIVSCFGACIDESDGSVYQVLELISGGVLSDYYMTPAFTLEAFSRVTRELLDGMEYLHARNIAHRDLRPDNILLSKTSKEVKISNFGLSSKQRAENGVGSPLYMPPEIFNESGPVDAQAGDVFGVATVLWELWYKQVPWEGKKAHAVLLETTKGVRLDSEGPDSPTPHADSFGQPTSLLTDVWEKCWNAAPKKRPTMSQVRTETEKFLYSLNLPGQASMGSAAPSNSTGASSGTVRKISKKVVKSSKKPALSTPKKSTSGATATVDDSVSIKSTPTKLKSAMKSPSVTPNSTPLEPIKSRDFKKMGSLDTNQRLGTAL